MSNKKAPAKARGGRAITLAGGQLSTPQYKRKAPKKQVIRDLSNLLDQALFLSEHHDALARFHTHESTKHRAILRSLQRLIPSPSIHPGGNQP